MTSQLEVKRLDSPLARTQRRATDARADRPKREAAKERSSRPAPAAEDKRRLTSVPADPAREAEARAAAFADMPEPPPLDEPLELVSTRLPTSLRRSLSELTTALRARDGQRVSQKSLPEQEVIALLVWLAGAVDDPETITRLGAALDAFRARRYAAAARALSPS